MRCEIPSKLRHLDEFGKVPSQIVNRRDTYGTKVGAFLTISFYVMLIMYLVIGISTYISNRADAVRDNENSTQSPFTDHIPEGLLLSFDVVLGEETKGFQKYLDASEAVDYFHSYIYYQKIINNQKIRDDYSIIACNQYEENWNQIKEVMGQKLYKNRTSVFGTFSFNNTLVCMKKFQTKTTELTDEQVKDEENINAFNIALLRCTTSTNPRCKSTLTTDLYLTFYLIEPVRQLDDYERPISKRYNKFTSYKLTGKMQTIGHINLKKMVVTNREGLWFTQFNEVDSVIMIDQVYEDQMESAKYNFPAIYLTFKAENI